MHKTQPTLSPKANPLPSPKPKTIPNPNPNPKPTPNPNSKNRLKSLKNKRSTDACTSVPQVLAISNLRWFSRWTVPCFCRRLYRLDRSREVWRVQSLTRWRSESRRDLCTQSVAGKDRNDQFCRAQHHDYLPSCNEPWSDGMIKCSWWNGAWENELTPVHISRTSLTREIKRTCQKPQSIWFSVWKAHKKTAKDGYEPTHTLSYFEMRMKTAIFSSRIGGWKSVMGNWYHWWGSRTNIILSLIGPIRIGWDNKENVRL